MMAVTDPAVLEAIEAEFTRTVYDAARLAHRRRRGLALTPLVSTESLELRRRALAIGKPPVIDGR